MNRLMNKFIGKKRENICVHYAGVERKRVKALKSGLPETRNLVALWSPIYVYLRGFEQQSLRLMLFGSLSSH